jgi:hypothetical protein
VTEKLKKNKVFVEDSSSLFNPAGGRFGATHLQSRENEMPKRPAFGQQMEIGNCQIKS